MSKTPPSSLTETTNFPAGKLAAVTRKRNEIDELLIDDSEDNKIRVRQLYTEFLQKVEVLIEACNELLKNENTEKDKLETWFQERNEVILEFRKKVEKYLARDISFSVKTTSNRDGVSCYSGKTRSSARSSTRSSTSSAKVRLAEKKAKLAAEKLFFDKSAQLEQQKREKNYAREQEEAQHQLELRKVEMEQAEEENNILERELHKMDNNLISNQDLVNDPSPTVHFDDSVLQNLNTRTNRMKGTQQCNNSNLPITTLTSDKLIDVLAKQNEISITLARSYEKASLPKKELVIFDGKDLTMFNSFMQTFRRVIENKCDSDEDRLYYLEQYTALGPNQLVKSCNHCDATQGFASAKRLLQEEYGNEYKIANAYLQKLEEWNPIKSEDGASLRELSVFLMSILNYMNDMQSLHHLNSPKEMLVILKKLPYKLKEKWRNTTLHLSETNCQITFKHLVDFVRRQAALVNQPLFGDILKDSPSTERQNRGTTKSFGSKTRTLYAATDKFITSESSSKEKFCACCKKNNHELNDCKFFIKKPPVERSEFVKKNGFCFGCLKSDHRSRGCTNRLTCNICNRKHPTCLHDDNRIKQSETNEKFKMQGSLTAKSEPEQVSTSVQSTENQTSTTGHSNDNLPKVTSYYTGASGNKKVICPIIPIRIKVKGNNPHILTYAALDSFSSDCFLNDALLKRLGIKGQEANIYLTTMENKQSKIKTKVLNDLELTDLNGNERVVLPVVYAKGTWPFTKQDVPDPNDILNFPHLKNVPFRYIEDNDAEVGILLGMNQPNILKPLQVVDGNKDGIYASRHLLGWAVNGPIQINSHPKIKCHRIKLEKKDDLETQIKEMYNRDFTDHHVDEVGQSMEDRKWEQKVQTSLKLMSDKHYEIELPFRDEKPLFPSNRIQVFKHFENQKKRLNRDVKYCNDYHDFMNMMLKNNFMEKVPQQELKTEPGQVWFLSHHGVYHKTKKKIRVVFNCSLEYKGVSLNSNLLQGPDLTNNLLGVLLRFRQGKFAFMGDVAKMFYQVKVPTKHSNFMRFFWYPDGNMNKEPIEYRLTRHVFGATSSPSIANFALRQTVSDSTNTCNEARRTVERNFYVDDLLKSHDDVEKAIQLLKDVREILSVGSFRLTGFVSNSRTILNTITPDDLAGNLVNLDLSLEDLPFNRALGVIWNAERDTISFKINLCEQPLTRRGILATIFGIYDPLGISGPAIIIAKKIFQETCRLKLQWDEDLPMCLRHQWTNWLAELPLLTKYEVPRCYKPLGTIQRTELHTFCDGSEIAYGIVSYIRFVLTNSEIYCMPIIAKARLTPLNNTALKTIPRIELNAARLAITVQQLLHRELELDFDAEYFWSDSTTVLNYIWSETKRFHRFVSNRVTIIRMNSSKEQWNYVPTRENPADIISRGISISDFMKAHEWRCGPRFLYRSIDSWPKLQQRDEILDSDIEIRKEVVVVASRLHEQNATNQLLESASNWCNIKCKVAWMLRLKIGLHHGNWSKSSLNVAELNKAEVAIWKYIQSIEYTTTIHSIQHGKPLQQSNKLIKLWPFIDENGLLRVGGRLARATASYSVKHPIILPSDSYVVMLLVRNIHYAIGHLGRESVMSKLRLKYWIVGLNMLTRKIIRECLQCRKRQSKPSVQLMADLPVDRVTGDLPAFTNTGVDYFGPFLVKQGRKSQKRYGVIFTCLASRAVHLEIAHSLDTSSFICALRRFLSRRGNVKRLRSDNGTNFVGSNRELKQAIMQWNVNSIENWTKQKEIDWKFQPPAASHFGGVWEREIRSIRRVLSALMNEQHLKLSDEELSTLMCEVEGILNSRPLTEISSDPNDLEALTPNHLLLLHSGVTFPPGLFDKDDLYSKKRWKQVQYLADLFWTRWKKEYLPLLQSRQKWTKDCEPHQIGDLVLITDNLLPRNQWSVGRITDVASDGSGRVRSAKIRIAKYKDGSTSRFGTVEIHRPIVKLILLKSVKEL